MFPLIVYFVEGPDACHAEELTESRASLEAQWMNQRSTNCLRNVKRPDIYLPTNKIPLSLARTLGSDRYGEDPRSVAPRISASMNTHADLGVNSHTVMAIREWTSCRRPLLPVSVGDQTVKRTS
jgi:hypothetical protein